MMLLSLTEAPASLPDSGRQRWVKQEAGTPQVGDLWLLSWDGIAEGLVLIASVKSDFVTAWPVTLPDEPSFAPAVRLPASPLDAPLTLWPMLETGLGRHLLHRRFGSALSERAVMNLRRYAHGEASSPLEPAPGTIEDADNRAFISSLMSHLQGLCFNEWPRPEAGAAVLDPDAARKHDANIGALTRLLGVPVHRARGLLTGDQTPTAVEIATLAAAWGASEEELLARSTGEHVRALLDAQFKPALLRLMNEQGINEARARQAAQQEFVLAARSERKDPTALMREALNRLIGPIHGSA